MRQGLLYRPARPVGVPVAVGDGRADVQGVVQEVARVDRILVVVLNHRHPFPANLA